MLYREIIAVCSEIHTKHINTLCGQNVELLNVKKVRIQTYSLVLCVVYQILSVLNSLLLFWREALCVRDAAPSSLQILAS